jgi:hypothetical protein
MSLITKKNIDNINALKSNYIFCVIEDVEAIAKH